jgi:hypothetical protein
VVIKNKANGKSVVAKVLDEVRLSPVVRYWPYITVRGKIPLSGESLYYINVISTRFFMAQCPSCGYGCLDLSPSVFKALGNLEDGVLPVRHLIIYVHQYQ